MGTIKDITDLTIDLINTTQDRKLTAKITAIQSLIATLQSEQSATVTENLDLRKKIFELEKENLALKEKPSPVNLKDKYTFIKELGIYKSKEAGHYFCTSCLMKNIESPLTEKENGWQCEVKGCDKFYSNPSYKSDSSDEGSSWLSS